MARTITYASAELGVRQFLSIGATVPTRTAAHDVAHQVAPESRPVYVGDDLVVLAHAHEMRAGNPTAPPSTSAPRSATPS